MRLENAMGLALAAGFFSFVAVAVILRQLGRVESVHQEERLGGLAFLGIAVLLLAMAFVEEGLFRWLIIGQGSRFIGLVPAFLVSVVLFTIAHRPNGRLSFGAVLNLLVVSVILGFVFLRWGLWVAAAAHAGWNLAEWGLGFTVSGERNRKLLPSPRHREVKGEPYGPEGHWSASLVLMVVLVLLINFGRPHF
ncbi:CPBP family intramembrane glutamic endopeptidase [Sulfobacillus harzensis]|uniref:CPBP family intramembrane metalloprotease n=1 Tax=Sulfobacillus harzensis TaxID=2729629 RepID=A0A7Y0L7Q2_9FIRM|nr:CPBP family intramembrane glutamic endopeptidase [Sulfobacillus harzensis]NMP23454.1 CPBP family intramembrane metalloprotease [Sulfobacillus harzensis]